MCVWAGKSLFYFCYVRQVPQHRQGTIFLNYKHSATTLSNLHCLTVHYLDRTLPDLGVRAQSGLRSVPAPSPRLKCEGLLPIDSVQSANSNRSLAELTKIDMFFLRRAFPFPNASPTLTHKISVSSKFNLVTLPHSTAFKSPARSASRLASDVPRDTCVGRRRAHLTAWSPAHGQASAPYVKPRRSLED